MGKPTGFMEIARRDRPYEPIGAAGPPLARIRRCRCRRASCQPAGRALHGLRHPLLSPRLSGQQHHPGLERPGVPRRLAGGPRGPALDQQLPGVHRPHLPGAVRGGVHAEHQRPAGDDQDDRVRHHRQGLGGGLGPPADPRRTAPASGSPSSAPVRRARLRPAAGARRSPRRRLREARPHRRPAALRHPRLQDGKASDRPAHGADAGRGRGVPPEQPRRPQRPGRSGCSTTSTRWCWPAAPRRRAICRCRAASSTASTSPWTSSPSRTPGSPAATCRRGAGNPRHRQARRRDRRRRHRLRLRRHLDPPGGDVGHPDRDPAAAAGEGGQGADLAAVAAEAADLDLARGRLRARLGGLDPPGARRRPGARRWSWCASSGSRATNGGWQLQEVDGSAFTIAGRPGAAGDGLRPSGARRAAERDRRRSSTRAATSRPTPRPSPVPTRPTSPRCSPPATCAAASRWWSGRSARAASAPAPSTSS